MNFLEVSEPVTKLSIPVPREQQALPETIKTLGVEKLHGISDR